MKKILLAVDGSEHSTRAASTAGLLSSALGVPVDVVNVVSDTTTVTAGPIHEYARTEQNAVTQREMLESVGADLVTDAASAVRSAGGEVTMTKVLIGPPAHEIVRYAEENDVDWIVMGRRGLGNVAGLLMGSVSHKVGNLTERTLITTE